MDDGKAIVNSVALMARSKEEIWPGQVIDAVIGVACADGNVSSVNQITYWIYLLNSEKILDAFNVEIPIQRDASGLVSTVVADYLFERQFGGDIKSQAPDNYLYNGPFTLTRRGEDRAKESLLVLKRGDPIATSQLLKVMISQ